MSRVLRGVHEVAGGERYRDVAYFHVAGNTDFAQCAREDLGFVMEPGTDWPKNLSMMEEYRG